jgi:type IV pilus assembly protein PilE
MRLTKSKGFTLIELMIVVVVLGILIAIAYPAYTNQVQKTRRADATAALLGAAQQLERCFTRFNSYQDASCPNFGVIDADGAGGSVTERGFYRLGYQVRTPTSFRLEARPQGAQRNDNCGTFTLDHRGNRFPLPSADRCWGS